MTNFIFGAILACVLAAALGYWKGHENGSTEVRAEWNVERLKQADEIAKLRTKNAQLEDQAAQKLKEQADAYTAEIKRRETAAASARAELDRLRRVVASATSVRPATATAATGSPSDGGSTIGELFSQCAGQLLDMAEEADRLVGQVNGLQEYARTAQQFCGTGIRAPVVPQ